MDYNFHTHTYLCSHATGTPEEYIEVALENGVTEMGFSEHIPFPESDSPNSFYRLRDEDIEIYKGEVERLREKYKGKINIRLGFEMEYFRAKFDEMLAYSKKHGIEYLILGEHYFIPENNPNAHYVAIKTDNSELLDGYTKSIVDAIKTGVFTYVAHPDLFNYTGDKEYLREKFREICVAARETGTPLEINFLGIRDNRPYPKEFFWQIAGEERSPVTFGFDAHDKTGAYDGRSLKKAMELVDKYRLNYIGKPKLIGI